MNIRYREGNNSTVTHLSQTFLVDDLIDLTIGKLPEVININNLVWVLPYTTVDEQRVKEADVNIPLIVLLDKDMTYTVLDGAHRLTKLNRNGKLFVSCFIINEFQLPTNYNFLK